MAFSLPLAAYPINFKTSSDSKKSAGTSKSSLTPIKSLKVVVNSATD
jgi:hypothetical protein